MTQVGLVAVWLRSLLCSYNNHVCICTPTHAYDASNYAPLQPTFLRPTSYSCSCRASCLSLRAVGAHSLSSRPSLSTQVDTKICVVAWHDGACSRTTRMATSALFARASTTRRSCLGVSTKLPWHLKCSQWLRILQRSRRSGICNLLPLRL